LKLQLFRLRGGKRERGEEVHEIAMMWERLKVVKWREVMEKGQTIEHKLVTPDQYVGIHQKLQYYFDVYGTMFSHF
jgi:hypothetical protein